MRIVLVAALVLAGCVEGEILDIPDHDSGWEADSFAPDSEIDAADPLPDAEPPVDAEPPPPCNVFAWPDADGDGYGDENAEPVEACDEIPVGYVANADDCYDGNANAKPGQTAWFTVHRGDGSFDYDCDGSSETRYNQFPGWCLMASDDAPSTGWLCRCLIQDASGCVLYDGCVVPECGEEGKWTSTNAGCSLYNMKTQECR